MFAHFDQAEEALWLLKRNTATATDPWLISSEIAVANLLERSPSLIKAGRKLMIAGAFSDQHLTELRSAIGTDELRNGNIRAAKKSIRAALVGATDNTVAQVEWVTRRVGDLDVDPSYLATPYSFEARSWNAYVATNWKTALEECQDWLKDEPFSRRAAVLGTHIAGGVLCDYDTAAQLAVQALKANPTDPILLNNLAFALASAGKAEEARVAYDQMERALLDDETRVYWLATGGLLKFREGFQEEGRALYNQAIDLAGPVNTSRRAVAATLYLAREEALAYTPYARPALNRAHEALRAFHGDFPESLKATFEKILALLPPAEMKS
jgi:tetratricopeptide (TPR) repeat protein